MPAIPPSRVPVAHRLCRARRGRAIEDALVLALPEGVRVRARDKDAEETGLVVRVADEHGDAGSTTGGSGVGGEDESVVDGGAVGDAVGLARRNCVDEGGGERGGGDGLHAGLDLSCGGGGVAAVEGGRGVKPEGGGDFGGAHADAARGAGHGDQGVDDGIARPGVGIIID